MNRASTFVGWYNAWDDSGMQFLLEGAFYEGAQCFFTSSDAFSPEIPASVA